MTKNEDIMRAEKQNVCTYYLRIGKLGNDCFRYVAKDLPT